jgi:hypothetical protein
MIEKIRAQQVTIDLPTEEAEPWVRAVIQRVMKDPETYETNQTVDRIDAVHRRLSDFAMMQQTFTDPVTGGSVTLSGVGCGQAIIAFVKAWMLEDFPGYVENIHGDIVKE